MSTVRAVDSAAIIERLSRFPRALRGVASVVSDADAVWSPAPEHWSVLEVCCHLLDEEREDFRVRLELTLRDPKLPWPALDLKDVSEKRGYRERSLGQTLEQFEGERARSVEWLRGVAGTRWELAHHHPTWGSISAGTLLGSWAAHDALHLRQIARRLHDLARRDAGGHPVEYAGPWSV